MPQESCFIVIEGLDGTGKTAMAHQLAATLGQRLGEAQVLVTDEPHAASCGGDFLRAALGRQIRPVTNWTLALAFAANRADHTTRFITPFLDEVPGRVVICDRYYLSSLVYQSSESLPAGEVMALNAGARRPDLTLFLNASNQVCYDRMHRRDKDQEMFEDQLEQLRDKYHHLITFLQARGEQIEEINAEPDMATVLDSMLAALARHAPPWLTPFATSGSAKVGEINP
jgi:dTMP kinase